MVVARAAGSSLLASVVIVLAATIAFAWVTAPADVERPPSERERSIQRIEELKRLDARRCWGRAGAGAGCPVVKGVHPVIVEPMISRCVDNPLGC